MPAKGRKRFGNFQVTRLRLRPFFGNELIGTVASEFRSLPLPLGQTMAELVPVDLGTSPPSRDNWLGYHQDLKRLPELRALSICWPRQLQGRSTRLTLVV